MLENKTQSFGEFSWYLSITLDQIKTNVHAESEYRQIAW